MRIRFLAYLGVFILPLSSIADIEPMRTFTSFDGKKIEGRLLDVKNDDVEIKRADGLVFRADISIFSEEDRQYIRNWDTRQMLENVQLKVKTNILSKHIYSSESGVDKHSFSFGYYKVDINNTSFEMLRDIEVRYMFYVKQYNNHNDVQVKYDIGRHFIENLRAGGTHSFHTSKSVLISRSPLPILNEIKGKDTHFTQRDDTLLGIEIQIFINDVLVHTYEDIPEGFTERKVWPKMKTKEIRLLEPIVD